MVDPSKRPDEVFTYVDISSIDKEKHAIAHPRRVLGGDAPSRARQPIEEEDVLFSNVRPYLRNVAQVGAIEQPAIASTGFTVLRANSEAVPRYLFHLARSRFFLIVIAGSESGTHYPAASTRKIRSTEIAIPSAEIQEQIADNLDRLEEIKQRSLRELTEAKTMVSRLLDSAVTQACAGTLTQQWRRERSTAADESSAEFEKARHVSGPLSSVYPFIPLRQCIEDMRYGTSQRTDQDSSGIPVLRMGNIQDGELDWSDLRYLPSEDINRLLVLQNGDVLFNRTNSADLVGKTAVFRGNRKATFASYLIRVRVKDHILHPDWLNTWLNSPYGRQWAAEVRTAGANQANISGSKLGELHLPLPDYDEQVEILRTLNHVRQVARATLERIDEARRRVAVAADTILDHAVAGPDIASLEETMAERSTDGRVETETADLGLGPIPWTDVRRKGHLVASSVRSTGPAELMEIVNDAGGRMGPGELWQASSFANDIDLFYAELRKAVSNGVLLEVRNEDGFPSLESTVS